MAMLVSGSVYQIQIVFFWGDGVFSVVEPNPWGIFPRKFENFENPRMPQAAWTLPDWKNWKTSFSASFLGKFNLVRCELFVGSVMNQPTDHRIILVLVIGGRDFIIPLKAIYLPGIYPVYILEIGWLYATDPTIYVRTWNIGWADSTFTGPQQVFTGPQWQSRKTVQPQRSALKDGALRTIDHGRVTWKISDPLTH